MLEIFTVNMTSFKKERMIRVYLPKNYEMTEKRYPVLYMHDGQNVFQDEGAIGGVSLNLENYLDQNELEVIVVAIDQNSEERINEYCPWVQGEYSKRILGEVSTVGGKGKQYVDFIVSELKPLIDNKYPTIVDRTSMAGISLGGLISTYAACQYPHIFKNIIVLSSAFWRNQEEIEQLLQNSDLSLIESFYMDSGTKEAVNNEEVNREFLASNQAVYEILKEKVPNTRFLVIEDAVHNYTTFRKRVHELFSY
ncbi:alpha/beta hydrolase [Peribacillus alkalitolerans]|uniref:alpha/beta hydrolase n=1 Tax=Peribacillus alkalitolerans TaxID=1550385 RepID=UPI0013D32F1A|nr:alpha/beta hydrolase-fold protein [Peribacillus alkalitolerans]